MYVCTYGMVWYGMVWYGMVWYGMVWYGMYVYISACGPLGKGLGLGCRLQGFGHGPEGFGSRIRV